LFAVVIGVNAMDFLYTFYAVPAYIFLVRSHYLELLRRNGLEEVREAPLTERGSSRAFQQQRETP
jgi:hypothetical protein